eukprot:6205447-Pleurochrysis_carterae.AAC.5
MGRRDVLGQVPLSHVMAKVVEFLQSALSRSTRVARNALLPGRATAIGTGSDTELRCRELDLDGRIEGVDAVPMEVRTTAAAASASVARDPRKHTIHPGSRDVGCSETSRVCMVRTRARARISDEEGMACVRASRCALAGWYN